MPISIRHLLDSLPSSTSSGPPGASMKGGLVLVQRRTDAGIKWLLGGVRARNKRGVLRNMLTKSGLELHGIVRVRLSRRGECWLRWLE